MQARCPLSAACWRQQPSGSSASAFRSAARAGNAFLFSWCCLEASPPLAPLEPEGRQLRAEHPFPLCSLCHRVGVAWATLVAGAVLWGSAYAVHTWPHLFMLAHKAAL